MSETSSLPYVPPSSLTPAQRAAQTRAANKAAGTTGAKAGTAKAIDTSRPVGMDLQLWISHGANRLELTFVPAGPDGLPMSGLATAESSLIFLRWTAYPDFSVIGELGGFEICTLSLYNPGTHTLEAALPLMRRTDNFLALARDESEDSSFAFAASALASHFRVNSVHVRMPDGATFEGKRGAAYVTAHRLSEALMAAQPRPAPEPATPPEPEPKPEAKGDPTTSRPKREPIPKAA
jgi:hypothetical protein